MFEPYGAVLEEAWAVAGELGLPRWWLNEQASAYVAPGGDPGAPWAKHLDLASVEAVLAQSATACAVPLFPRSVPFVVLPGNRADAPYF